jgi:hypothetical protein
VKVVFPYLAQMHQTLHSLPIALELAARHPDFEVHVACLTEAHLKVVRDLAAYYPEATVRFDLLRLPEVVRDTIPKYGQTLATKLLALWLNRDYFATFQAIVVPERTSLLLRRFGVRKPKMIWTRHGAGDRAIGFTRDISRFDFVLLSGRKLEQRLLANGYITPGHYVVGVYAKFDLVRRLHVSRPRLFENDRPTVLYNPHYRRHFSSWPLLGPQVLDWFAGQDRYNLIFAPHFRLFDPPDPICYKIFKRFANLPHIRIDLGSMSSVDMTYTLGADLYLGDVSSQLAEFMIEPRPCVFLNPRRTPWQGDQNYRSWTLGEVVDRVEDLPAALGKAVQEHPARIERQRAYFRETFEVPDTPTAPIGADAIASYLRRAT